MAYLKKRKKWYHFRRRVPDEYKHLHRCSVLQASLKTDSEVVARARCASLNEALENYWYSHRDSKIGDHDELEKMISTAKSFGFSYKPANKVTSNEPVERVIERLSIAGRTNEKLVREAVLGVGGHEQITLDRAFKDYARHETANLSSSSDRQKHVWKSTKKRSVDNFKSVVGNVPVSEISREQILKYREWWADRITAGSHTANTANKDISALRVILRLAGDNYSLSQDFDQLFKRTGFTEAGNSRSPFESRYITEVLLCRERLNMNEECILFIYAMADTGARVGELVGLNFEEGDIQLDHDVPHIKIRPNKIRSLKTPQSERDIPLVGASLVAFTELNQGFQRYLGKNTLISSTIGKYLREHELLPSTNHTLYSLRHSFEDRLTAVEPPDKVQAALMGHKYVRPRYGFGPSLEQKLHWLQKTSLL